MEAWWVLTSAPMGLRSTAHANTGSSKREGIRQSSPLARGGLTLERVPAPPAPPAGLRGATSTTGPQP